MIALDTNVLIYACDKSDPARQQIALDLIANTTEGVILWQVACEFVAASRKLDRQGFTAADAWARRIEAAQTINTSPYLVEKIVCDARASAWKPVQPAVASDRFRQPRDAHPAHEVRPTRCRCRSTRRRSRP
jgi:predicted nucleic acid-binding protein